MSFLRKRKGSHIIQGLSFWNGKWLLKIAEDKKVVVNLRHLMDFGDGSFKIRVLNTNTIVNNMGELLDVAGELV